MKILDSLTRISCLAFAGVALLSPRAQAASEESIPGAACQQTYDTSTVNFAHMTNGRAYNNTTSAMGVNCPIQRTNPESTGEIWSPVYVNNPSGKTTTCSLLTTDVDGTNIDSDTESTSATGFSAIYLDVATNVAWGSANISCTVPSHGFVNEYFVFEY